MTKKELLAVAKTYDIKGRHDMTVVQLQQAVDAFERQQTVSKEQLKEVTRRYPSLRKRDETGKVVRAGKNLSGNVPFNYKYYYLNPALADESRWTPAYREAFDASPAQVKGLLRYMAAHVTSKNNPRLGSEIAGSAIRMGYVVSKIDPDKLAAYYRRALEVLGMIYAVGYDPDGENEGGNEE